MHAEGGGVDYGDGVRRTCILPDGKSVPAGEEFNYEHEGIRLVCACPPKPNGVKIQVQCRRDNGGTIIYAI